MKGKFVRWRRELVRRREIRRALHAFTKWEIRLGVALSKVEYALYPLTLHRALFCYTGSCSACASPVNRFYVPVHGSIVASNLPDDREWFVLRHMWICPHCGKPIAYLGIFKTYDITDEIKALKKNLQETNHE